MAPESFRKPHPFNGATDVRVQLITSEIHDQGSVIFNAPSDLISIFLIVFLSHLSK